MTSVWRTWPGRVLLAWMALVVFVALAYGPLLEVLSSDAVSWGGLLVLFGAPAALLPWSLWALIRRPRSAWPAPAGLLLFCAAFVFGGDKPWIAGGWLNLMRHRVAYDAVVADAKAGRLPGAGSDRWVEGSRGGVDYIVAAWSPTTVIFPWHRNPYGGGWIGVTYDEEDCPPHPPPPPAPFVPEPGEGDPPTLKNAGRLDQRFHLTGRYCFTYFGGM